MKNPDSWKQTKFEFAGNVLRGSRDQTYLSPASRIIMDLVASEYQKGFPQHASGSLLDLGCGHCPLYASYRDEVDEVICVDWGETLHKNELLDFEADLSQPLPIENSRFDTILLSDVLEHLPCPELIWKEMYRILRPGGKVLMNTPFLYRLHETPNDYYRYTRYALEHLAKNQGFLIVELRPLGGAPEVIFDVTGKVVAMVHQFNFLQKIYVNVAQFILWTRILKPVSRRTVEDFPLGYYMVAQKPSQA